jgi:hypothetical protein
MRKRLEQEHDTARRQALLKALWKLSQSDEHDLKVPANEAILKFAL